MKKLSIVLAFLLSLIDLSNQEACPTFSCGPLPEGDCTQRKEDASTQVYSYTLQECKGSTRQCPFYNLETESDDTLHCEEKSSVPIKMYPGGPCQENDDCMSGTCKDGVCSGSAEKEKCKSHSECYYGFACIKSQEPTDSDKYCSPQKKEGDSCESDYECENAYGCYFGKCTPYLSLKDGTTVEFTPAKTVSFCESGFEHENKCARLTLLERDSACSDSNPCKYSTQDGQTLTIPEHCECGYNREGKRFCKIGNGDKEYTKYLEDIKNLIQDTTDCNTLERGRPCNHNRKLPSKPFSFLAGNFTNSQILAENYHKLQKSDKCVLKVAFPEYIPDGPGPGPEPEIFTCANYSCKRGQKFCAHSHQENDIINVILSDVCDSKSFCNIGGEPNEVFYKNEDVNATCSVKSIPTGIRYPGEECKQDIDCFAPDKTLFPDEKLVGTCKNGRCQGYFKNQSCKETAWCSVGLYCNEEEKCVPLLGEGSICTQTNQCQNNLMCYEGKCEDQWYSQPAGTEVTGKGDLPYEYYCQYGKVLNGVCTFYNSTATPDPKSGLVECVPQSDCEYETVEGPKTIKCQCGYNQEGLSYCPKGTNTSKLFI